MFPRVEVFKPGAEIFFSGYCTTNMGGGLLQLVAYGAQDIYLTGNPQITFFKVVYRRHTNFAMESIEQTFNGAAGFGKRVTTQISRNGDLIHRIYLEATLPGGADAEYVDYAGLRLIKNVEIEIGGQRIDKHYSEWLYIWNQLSLPHGKKDGFEAMVGNGLSGTGDKTLHIPLEFWFCRNVGLALPLIALQYHEVKINIDFEQKDKMFKTSTQAVGDIKDASLWVDYIFLDTDERRRFAQLSHEYLIEQLQFTGAESFSSSGSSITPRIKLNFNHPVKELVWVVQRDEVHTAGASNAWTNYLTSAGDNLVERAKIQLNGHDRFAERTGDYFSLVQPFQHHENVPFDPILGKGKGINVYSFALKPEEHQPSGTLNMSRIDTAVLSLTTPAVSGGVQVKVYAVNYNVLRVMSGMGGLAYSN
jgi:hypothetical protein